MEQDYPRLEVSADLHRRMIEIARQFRKEPTLSEHVLWQALRGKKLDGLKFRRQQPIGSFIVDFYNSEFRLVVEVDGPIHNQQMDADRARQEILELLGLNILRLKAEMVESNLPKVLSLIRERVHALSGMSDQDANLPSPFMGEGQGGG